MDLRLLTRETIGQLIWPKTLNAEQIKAFFLPLMQEGIDHFIENVQTRLFIVQLNDHLIPITVNEKEYENAYVASNYVFLHILKQRMRSKKALRLLMPFVLGLDMLLKGAKINKAIIINNWFLTLSLHQEFTIDEVKAFTNFLSKQFNDHSIMFRSINSFKSDLLHCSLEKNGYRLIPTRKIYIFDPTKKHNYSVRRHWKRDSALFQKSGYTILRNEDITPSDYKRLIQLYEMIYIEKYHNVSPIFSKKFIHHLLHVYNVHFFAVKREQIDGFSILFRGDKEMFMGFMGHDTTLDLSLGIYRMVNYLALQVALNENVILNQSSGADIFKSSRGGILTSEYVAIYDKHLSLPRRAFFATSARAIKLFRTP